MFVTALHGLQLFCYFKYFGDVYSTFKWCLLYAWL